MKILIKALCELTAEESMLDVCKTVSCSDARFVWVDESCLLENGVQPWGELPLWIPDADAPHSAH